jgi:hypothetical protein
MRRGFLLDNDERIRSFVDKLLVSSTGTHPTRLYALPPVRKLGSDYPSTKRIIHILLQVPSPPLRKLFRDINSR